jgi:beta-N-acetylhexosaminidase
MVLKKFVIGIKNYEEGFEVIKLKPYGIFLGSNFKDKNRKELKKFIQELKKTYKRIKIFTDQEGGYASWVLKGYPSPSDIGKLSKKNGLKILKKMAEELNELLIDVNLAPCVDICYDRENEVICKKNRSFGDSNKKVTEKALLFFRTMKKKGIMCCAKHFLNQARAKEDPHKELPESEADWDDLDSDLIPYKKLIKEGIEFIMPGFIKYKKISKEPVLFSEFFIKVILRKKLRFKGILITDDLCMRGILKKYSLKEAIKKSIEAGCDIILVSDFKKLMEIL